MLREDAEKADSLEDVIEELERLQLSEAEKAREVLALQETIQVWLHPPSQCHACYYAVCHPLSRRLLAKA